MRATAHYLSRSWGLAALALVAVIGGCASRTEPLPTELAYAARSRVAVRAALAPNSTIVANVSLGDSVEILSYRRSAVRVRVGADVEGWAQQSELIGANVRRQVQALAAQTRAMESQGAVRAFDRLNVHLQPLVESPTIYQLQEEEAVDLLDRRVMLPKPGSGAAAKPRPTAWYLVRLATGDTGWVLGRRVYSGIPVEIAQFAEGRRITSYFAIGEVLDPALENPKRTWLWTQLADERSEDDFDRLRVFRWSPARRAYRTIKLERGLRGQLPIEILGADPDSPPADAGFAIRTKKEGEMMRRVYRLGQRRVRSVSEEPAPAQRELLIPAEESTPEPRRAPNLTERLREWWSDVVG